MSESVLIVLPLPSGLLSPNHKPASFGGRMQVAVSVRSYRAKAQLAAEEQGVETGPWERATVKAAFFHAKKNRRDDVNHLARLKPAYDGLVDAGLLEDDDSEHLTTLSPTFAIDREAPRVELLIERVA